MQNEVLQEMKYLYCGCTGGRSVTILAVYCEDVNICFCQFILTVIITFINVVFQQVNISMYMYVDETTYKYSEFVGRMSMNVDYG